MASGAVISLRVIITETNIRKLTVQDLSNVSEIEKLVKECFNIPYDFVVHYYDPEFKEYFILENIKDVSHLGTIKIVKVVGDSIPVDKTCKEHCTDNVNMKPSNPWPECFPVPDLNENPFITSHLAAMPKHQPAYVPEVLKRKVVTCLADEIIKFTYYPTGKDIENMCRNLVDKYPVLKDQGPGGYTSWCACVKFKMGNVCKNLKDIVPDISRNTGRRSQCNPLAPHPTLESRKCSQD